MNIEHTFGDTVKKLREQHNLPLRVVAEALGVDTSMLGKIEKNTRKPTREMIEKLADFFHVSGRDLLVAFLSDVVAYQIVDEEDLSGEVLKVAEEKVHYLKTQKFPEL